jgi:hypothetical protein
MYRLFYNDTTGEIKLMVPHQFLVENLDAYIDVNDAINMSKFKVNIDTKQLEETNQESLKMSSVRKQLI